VSLRVLRQGGEKSAGLPGLPARSLIAGMSIADQPCRPTVETFQEFE